MFSANGAYLCLCSLSSAPCARTGARRVNHAPDSRDRKSTRLNSSHGYISYAVFCLKKKKAPDHANELWLGGYMNYDRIRVYPEPQLRSTAPSLHLSITAGAYRAKAILSATTSARWS